MRSRARCGRRAQARQASARMRRAGAGVGKAAERSCARRILCYVSVLEGSGESGLFQYVMVYQVVKLPVSIGYAASY